MALEDQLKKDNLSKQKAFHKIQGEPDNLKSLRYLNIGQHNWEEYLLYNGVRGRSIEKSPLNITTVLNSNIDISKDTGKEVIVLDLGCGQNQPLRSLVQQQELVRGIGTSMIDIRTDEQKESDQQYSRLNYLEYFSQDFKNLKSKLDRNSPDIIICLNTLCHSIFPLESIINIINAMKIGSVLYFDWSVQKTNNVYFRTPFYINEYLLTLFKLYNLEFYGSASSLSENALYAVRKIKLYKKPIPKFFKVSFVLDGHKQYRVYDLISES